MDLEMVLNELSFRSLANDISTAQQWMLDLISTINVAAGHGVKKIIHIDRNLYDVVLAPDYPIARWLNDSQVDKDTRRFFRSLTTKLSFIADLPEFWYQEDQANGLGFAFQYELLAVSLRSELHWRSSRLKLEIRYPELDENDQLVTEQVEVNHASHNDHVLEHANWIKNRIQTEIQTAINDGLNLWSRRGELFPNLHFCESVGTQLQKLLHGDPMVQPIARRLLELENFCKNWREGTFSHKDIPCIVTPESTVTLSMYGRERTFLCPDGEKRIFTWHVRLTPNSWRLYFHPEEETRQLIIGYIGPHLPTVRDRT